MERMNIKIDIVTSSWADLGKQLSTVKYYEFLCDPTTSDYDSLRDLTFIDTAMTC